MNHRKHSYLTKQPLYRNVTGGGFGYFLFQPRKMGPWLVGLGDDILPSYILGLLHKPWNKDPYKNQPGWLMESRFIPKAAGGHQEGHWNLWGFEWQEGWGWVVPSDFLVNYMAAGVPGWAVGGSQSVFCTCLVLSPSIGKQGLQIIPYGLPENHEPL